MVGYSVAAFGLYGNRITITAITGTSRAAQKLKHRSRYPVLFPTCWKTITQSVAIAASTQQAGEVRAQREVRPPVRVPDIRLNAIALRKRA